MSAASLLAVGLLAFQDSTAPYGLVRDRLVLRVQTWTSRLNTVLNHAGVVSVKPIFQKPPRGWRDPAAARAADLESWYVARLAPPRDDVERIAAFVAQVNGVVSCHATRCGEPASTTPDDPDFPMQWALQATYLNGPDAWDVATTSSRIVAVIDNGTDVNHAELQSSLWTNPGEIAGNGIDDDGNGHVDDVHGWDFLNDDDQLDSSSGHGTRVSGVIGAAGNNALEVAGVCWSVPILLAKIYDFSGATLTVDNAAAAITYAADQGAAVMQMAWAFRDPEDVLRAAVDYALANDALMVSIPGNQPSDVPIYPAGWGDVMGIIATDPGDQKTFWSGFGDWNELSAPGLDIYTISVPGRGRIGSGTTFASSHTSGAAALVRELNPDLDWQGTQLVLQNSAKDLGVPGFDADTAWGRLDLNAAVRLATTLKVSPLEVGPGDDVTITLDLPGEPNMFHALFVTRFGRVPGIPLSILDPNDTRVFPLNWDDPLFPLVLGEIPGGDALFARFLDCTDGQGHSVATMHVAPGPYFLGTDLDFAALVFDPADTIHARTMTCNGRVRVR